MPPAARISDLHTCPMINPGPVPHVGGPIVSGFPTVMIGFMPAARVTDTAICVGPPDIILKGSLSVFIGNLSAARMGDPTVHGGMIVAGFPTVNIGDGMAPLFGQETPMSCGPASVRMLLATEAGRLVDEATLRNEAGYDPVNGTRTTDLVRTLQNNGVPNAQRRTGLSITDLQNATAGGHSAMVHYNNPGGGGHYAVVDGVRTNPDGTHTISVRDPWPPGQGTRQNMSEADFNARGYHGVAVTTNR